MAVSNKLKEILDQRGIKYIWLAEQVGVTRSTLGNIINGRYNTSLEVALKISKILNINIHEIFQLIDEDTM